MNPSQATRPFTGVVLAGGRSSRMGRDKATLLLPDGRSLLDRALQTLQDVGARELLVSVRPGQTYGKPNTREVVDAADNCGPLAGLIAALGNASTECILVLAVDLPAMSPDYLRKLLAASATHGGAVPHHGGFYEPLAAVYPRIAVAAAREVFSSGQYSLQAWVQVLAKKGQIQPVPVEPFETGFFANWNQPDDTLAG